VKVVLFCGGLGLRMREESTRLPKPMIPLGDRPILWHIMKYYSRFGCRDFILCLGYKAEVIKEYFLDYKEALSNDFVLRDGGRSIELLGSDTHDWSMTFVNTGLNSTIGERLKAVEQYLDGEEIFLANYGDGLTDAPLGDMIETLTASDKTALFLCVRPTYQFHVVSLGDGNGVEAIRDVVDGAFSRLIGEDKVIAYPYEGFWAPMDTLKDKQTLETLLESGEPPWTHPRGLERQASTPTG
jgi:glucose-1-phosphate cytidylyltransferase